MTRASDVIAALAACRRSVQLYPPSHPAYTEAYRLLKFLTWFVPIFREDVPATSLLREFIGGSAFTD